MTLSCSKALKNHLFKCFSILLKSMQDEMFLNIFDNDDDEGYEVIKLRKEICKRFSKNPLGVFHRNIGVSWYSAIRQELGEQFLQVIHELNEFLEEERKAFLVFPKQELVWRFTQDFDLEDTKVVSAKLLFFLKLETLLTRKSFTRLV